jgi:ATP-dependent protease ClpP protease subunit
MKQGISLRALASDASEAVIDVVGVIGWDTGFSQVRAILAAIPGTVKRIVFDIYSPGGDVFDSNAMIHEIGQLQQETVARVRVAASAATSIAVACKVRTMSANGRFLVHNPWTSATGDAQEFEARAKELRDAQAEMVAFYATRTGQAPDAITALMQEERWLMPDEAQAMGFIHDIEDPFEVAAFAPVRDALTQAGKWPKALAAMDEPGTDPETPDEPEVAAQGVCADCGHVQDKAEPPCEECGGMNVTEKGAGDDADTTGSESPEAPKEDEVSGGAPGADVLAASYADGRAAGDAEASGRLSAKISELDAEVKRLDALGRKLQGERDRLAAQIETEKKTNNVRMDELRAQLAAAVARAEKLIAGSLTFSAACTTWPEALEKCGSDYVKARRTYPDVYAQFMEASKNRKG